MSKDWDTSSLEVMEKTAKGQADFTCSKKFGDHWLEVRWMVECGHWFRYQWGKNLVSRQVAKNVYENGSK